MKTYQDKQIDNLEIDSLNLKDIVACMQIHSSNGKNTKWMDINREQLEKIRIILNNE